MLKSLRTFGFATNTIEEVFKADLQMFFDYLNSLGGKPFDAYQPLARLTTCTIARIACGANYLHLEDPELILLCEQNTSFIDALCSYGARWQYWADNTPIWLTSLLFPLRAKAMHQSTQYYVDFFLKKVLCTYE